MCGITGKLYFERSHNVSLDELKKMTNSIIHRGPDDEGYYINGNIGLGFRRLSIIDLLTGHQPLSNHDKSIWITFNGEVYNYQELRTDLSKNGYIFRTKTDTEVIVALYEKYGEKCLNYLRGMFAFVIWDNNKKKLFGARDRFGIKPLYYYLDVDKFVWGSEIKAINASDGITKKIDYCALDSYFTYGHITGKNKSIFNSIKKLNPAHYFVIKPYENNKIDIRPYWSINFEPNYSRTENQWAEEIEYLLTEAVKIRMRSDVPLGAFLSGGIDSSAIVALMASLSNKPIKTFSIGFKEEKYSELQYAKLIADKFNTEHHELIVEPNSIELLPKLVSAYDEPFADTSAIPTYYVSKFAREYVTVALSGDGGDELFAGYRSYAKMIQLSKNPFNNTFTNKYIFRQLNKIIPDYLYGKGYSYYLSKNKESIGAYFCIWKDYERDKLYNEDTLNARRNYLAENDKLFLLKNSQFEFLSRMQHLDIRSYLVDDILTKVDRASMMNSLEVRVPILDHKFAELTFRIPSDLKIRKDNKKHVFKKTLTKILPDKIIQHKKQGFGIPLNCWFKADLKDYVNDNLLNTNSLLLGYLDKKAIYKTVKNHQKGIRDYSTKLWSLLFLEEWLKQNN